MATRRQLSADLAVLHTDAAYLNGSLIATNMIKS